MQDCQTMPDNCIKVNCIAELNGRSSAYAEVTGYIDERFFSVTKISIIIY